MKHFLLLFIGFGILVSESESILKKYGFGMEYTPSLIIMGTEQPTPSIYLPIIMNNYMIEPIMSFKYDTDQDNMLGINVVETERLIAAGIGVYSLRYFANFRSYSGLKILYGERSDKTEYDLTSSYSSMNSETNESIFMLSPTIGG